jgi:hypothetical protein
MPNQNANNTGRVYDDDQVVAEVAYELNGEGQSATGSITFQDILECGRVAELLETKPLILQRNDGRRFTFEWTENTIGSSPTLAIRLVGAAS